MAAAARECSGGGGVGNDVAPGRQSEMLPPGRGARKAETMWIEGDVPPLAYAYVVTEHPVDAGREGPQGRSWWRPIAEVPGLEYAARSWARAFPGHSRFAIGESDSYVRTHTASRRWDGRTLAKHQQHQRRETNRPFQRAVRAILKARRKAGVVA